MRTAERRRHDSHRRAESVTAENICGLEPFPLGRYDGTPERAAALVTFLVTEGALFIVAHTKTADPESLPV